MIILATEQEVDEQDSNGGTGDYHDAVAEEEEAEHVVYLAKPHVVHDEIKLDEDSAEGKNADEEHRRNGSEVRSGRRYLAGYLVDADRRLHGLE